MAEVVEVTVKQRPRAQIIALALPERMASSAIFVAD
jgi:hypothetical protein